MRPNMESAVKAMKVAVVVMDDKKQKTIKITGIFKTPQLAARVVNAYVDELQKFINENSFTTAKRNRIFIEGQLAQNKEELLGAGKEINEFYRGNRVSSADAKVDVAIGNTGLGTGDSGLERPELLARNSVEPAEISDAPNAELRASNSESDTAGHGSPLPADGVVAGVTGHEAELNSLLSQKVDLEKKLAEANVVKNVPQQVYLTYLMLRRELLAKVNALLTTQYEMAKIEEAKEDLAFQVIDKAVPPVHKFAPKRAQICIMSFMAALFGAIFLAFFREYIRRVKKQMPQEV
jgi:tyrosine-protein kinase Etk/Wzc